MWLRNRDTVPAASTSLVVGVKCAILVRQLTTMRIAVNDSKGSSCTMKSMETDDQGASSTGKDWSKPYGCCQDVLFCRQVSHVLTYFLMNDLIVGHSYVHDTSLKVFWMP